MGKLDPLSSIVIRIEPVEQWSVSVFILFTGKWVRNRCANEPMVTQKNKIFDLTLLAFITAVLRSRELKQF